MNHSKAPLSHSPSSKSERGTRNSWVNSQVSQGFLGVVIPVFLATWKGYEGYISVVRSVPQLCPTMIRFIYLAFASKDPASSHSGEQWRSNMTRGILLGISSINPPTASKMHGVWLGNQWIITDPCRASPVILLALRFLSLDRLSLPFEAPWLFCQVDFQGVMSCHYISIQQVWDDGHVGWYSDSGTDIITR